MTKEDASAVVTVQERFDPSQRFERSNEQTPIVGRDVIGHVAN
jgi:hypothetical protein